MRIGISSRPHRTDGANDPPARRILLGTEYMLDPSAHLALLAVGVDLRVRQRMVSESAVMDAAFEAALVEFHLDLSRAIGAVGVHIPRRVGGVQQTIQLLAVVHRSVGRIIAADQLVPGVGIDVVLIAEEALAVLLGPARVLVLLPVFRGFSLPVLGSAAEP